MTNPDAYDDKNDCGYSQSIDGYGQPMDGYSGCEAPRYNGGGSSATWALTNEINKLKSLYKPTELVPEDKFEKILENFKTSGRIQNWYKRPNGAYEIFCQTPSGGYMFLVRLNA